MQKLGTHESLCLHPIIPLQGYVPRPSSQSRYLLKGDSIQVLPAVSYGSANATAELPGKGFLITTIDLNQSFFVSPYVYLVFCSNVGYFPSFMFEFKEVIYIL